MDIFVKRPITRGERVSYAIDSKMENKTANTHELKVGDKMVK